MPLLRKQRPSPQLRQATRSPMSQMFQQALWSGGTGWEDEGQEVDMLKSMTGAGLARSPPENSPEDREAAVADDGALHAKYWNDRTDSEVIVE